MHDAVLEATGQVAAHRHGVRVAGEQDGRRRARRTGQQAAVPEIEHLGAAGPKNPCNVG